MDTSLSEYKEHVGSCAECGNSPIPHTLAYIQSSYEVGAGIALKRIGHKPWYRKTMARWRHMKYGFDRFNFSGAHALGLVRYGIDQTKASSYRSQVIWEEAMRRSIQMQQVLLFGKYMDTYRAKIHGEWIYFESLPIPAQYEQSSYDWMDDKFLLKSELRKAGVPVPRTYSVRTLKDALAALQEIDGPVVVKPRVGTRGRHTTTFVQTPEEMGRAFKSAKVLCQYVSIEEQLMGSVCRATVVDGKLVGFFQADPPKVTGDGISSIEQLVSKANAEKPERVGDIVLNAEVLEFLKRLGYTPTSVLPEKTTISLGHRTGRLFGGITRELLDTAHPKLRAYVEKAATVLDIPVTGFDLIIEDPEKDPDTQKWGILEANTLPFIDLHYLPLYGKPSNPAAAVWDLWK